jgi:hypothetical protein
LIATETGTLSALEQSIYPPELLEKYLLRRHCAPSSEIVALMRDNADRLIRNVMSPCFLLTVHTAQTACVQINGPKYLVPAMRLFP